MKQLKVKKEILAKGELRKNTSQKQNKTFSTIQVNGAQGLSLKTKNTNNNKKRIHATAVEAKSIT